MDDDALMRYIGIFVACAAVFWLMIWYSQRPKPLREGLSDSESVKPAHTAKEFRNSAERIQKMTTYQRQLHGFEDSKDIAALKSLVSAKKEYLLVTRASMMAGLGIEFTEDTMTSVDACNTLIKACDDTLQYLGGSAVASGASGAAAGVGSMFGGGDDDDDDDEDDDDDDDGGSSNKKSSWF